MKCCKLLLAIFEYIVWYIFITDIWRVANYNVSLLGCGFQEVSNFDILYSLISEFMYLGTANFHFVCVDDYTKLPEYMAKLLASREWQD